jgi:Undecaprenyl-phosphate glucose phosphotransferase
MTNLVILDSESHVGIGELPDAALEPSISATRIERIVTYIVGAELLAISATCFLTSEAYFATVFTQRPPTLGYAISALLLASFIVIYALCAKQYSAIQAQSRDRYMWNGMGAVLLAFSIFLSLLFLLKIGDWYSRGTFFLQFLAVSTAMLVARGAAHNYVRRAIEAGTVEARRAILVGDPRSGRAVLNDLRRNGVCWIATLPFPSIWGSMNPGAKNLGAKMDPGAKTDPGAQPFANTIRSFVETCRSFRPDDIMFLTSAEDLGRTALLVEAVSELPVSAHVIPIDAHGLWTTAEVNNIGGTATIKVLHPPLSAFDLAFKRMLDVVAAGLGMLFLSPLLLMVSIAIKLDSEGPVFFRQNRHGYNNEVIPVLKFRSMSVVESGETAKTFTQAKANDARITRIGRILRRTNIDELPQLFNVLHGEMSIVGPRPHPIALNKMFQERIAPFSRRHNVKPGLTGWAQVNGYRGETDTLEKMQRRVECDLYYIDNWSFMLDLKIILMTIFSKGAYQNAF